jgi:hypothetical protein
LTAIGYPRPAPLLAASDQVFFEDRTAEPADRSTFINFISKLAYKAVRSCPSFRDAPLGAGPESITPNPGYGFRARSFSDKIDFVNFAQNSRPGMTAILSFLARNQHP